jgi:hypothetical protein
MLRRGRCSCGELIEEVRYISLLLPLEDGKIISSSYSDTLSILFRLQFFDSSPNEALSEATTTALDNGIEIPTPRRNSWRWPWWTGGSNLNITRRPSSNYSGASLRTWRGTPFSFLLSDLQLMNPGRCRHPNPPELLNYSAKARCSGSSREPLYQTQLIRPPLLQRRPRPLYTAHPFILRRHIRCSILTHTPC